MLPLHKQRVVYYQGVVLTKSDAEKRNKIQPKQLALDVIHYSAAKERTFP